MNKRIAFLFSVLLGLAVFAQVGLGQTSASISNLSAGSPLVSTDLFPIARSGGNYKISGADIAAFAAATQSINDAPGRALVTTTASTGYQISTSRIASVCYEGTFSLTSTIGGPAAISIFLETADTNSTTPSDWTTKAVQPSSNTITLAIVLNQVAVGPWVLCRHIPAGKFVRIRSGGVSGTATAAINTQQQEVLY